MKVRPEDGNGDMMPIQSLDQLIEDAPAVAQIMRSRVRLVHGEWWEDETLGFKAPQFLVDNVRQGNLGMLEQYISTYLAGTPGVARISDVELTFSNHKLRYSCIATTGTGGSEVVEVDLSGIL